MIVMKFGGSSLASSASIKNVADIVGAEAQKDEPPGKPVVVVSAIGDTTDQLIEILDRASRAETYATWKLHEELKNLHFCLAEDLLSGRALDSVECFLRQTFCDLHIRIIEVCEGERSVTPELRDWFTSLGEKLSSRIIAAAFQQNGIPTVHMDSTNLILTDDRFTNATPRYWETYARIRWAVPLVARHSVVVLGGFIGATEDGRTTTLGRGGSDLTASVVGAALNAKEIQVWKDVDGMLTWDPRIRTGAHRVKTLSYEEAAELARGGATILHPESMEPAKRLRIPVVIRNTFHPGCEGTRINCAAVSTANCVKSVAFKKDVTILELESPRIEPLAPATALAGRICSEHKSATMLGASEDTIYVGIEGQLPNESRFKLEQCTYAHVRANQAVATLVGVGISNAEIPVRLNAFVRARAGRILPHAETSCSVRIAINEANVAELAELLAGIFFAQTDPTVFAETQSTTPAEWEIKPHPQGAKQIVKFPLLPEFLSAN